MPLINAQMLAHAWPMAKAKHKGTPAAEDHEQGAEDKPGQPHDTLVKKIFGNPSYAQVELQAVLPSALQAAIDWSTLEVLPDTFIDPAFRKTQADLLFRMDIGGRDARIYVVFEHKSDAKAATLVQVGGYVMAVLARYFEHGGKLPAPVVIPVVLHHSEDGWNVAQSFHELFDQELLALPGVSEHVPDFRILLDDLSHQSDESLRARAPTPASLVVPLALWALRDARRGAAMLAALASWSPVIGLISRIPGARAALLFVLRYILLINDAITEPDLRKALAEATPETKEAVMTLAEQWMARGKAEGNVEGNAEGEARGERRMLERLLQLKFKGEVDVAVSARLAGADDAQLVVWAERVLDATTLAEVFR